MKKKINSVFVQSKVLLTNKYFKLLVSVLLILMIVMSAILIKVYIDINKSETQKNNSAKNIITQMDKKIDDYTVFEDENGLLGVSEKDGHVVIEPYWNDIYILSENRFIVSEMFDKKKKMGIIDCDSNILVPFIFESFNSFSNEFVGGFTGNKDDFILFDKDGNVLSEKVWTGYRYSDKIIYLKDSNNEYRGKFDDGEFKFIYVSLKRFQGNIPVNICFTDPKKIEKIGIENINRISDVAFGYLEYLISGDNSDDISDLTSEQYYSSLSSNDFFRECRIKGISEFSVDITEEKYSVSYNVKLVVNYDYSQKNVDLKDIFSEITFNIVSDENNRLILKSINKVEL